MAKYPYMMDVGETRELKPDYDLNGLAGLPEGARAEVRMEHGRKGKLLARYTVLIDGKRIGRVIRCGPGRYYYFELDDEPGTMFSFHYFSRDEAARAAVRRCCGKAVQ